jgi:NTE family protein
MNKRIAITFSGGGARAAYEVGVLRAISEMTKSKTCPFNIITGVSAGAINGMALASHVEDFSYAADYLWKTWESISVDRVFKADAFTLMKTGTRWMAGASLGAVFAGKSATHLLDTSPLQAFLSDRIDFKAIVDNISNGFLSAVSLSATDYYSGKLVTFFDGEDGIAPWTSTSGVGVRQRLTVQHVMASTAIPFFFPPVRVGNVEYGDGGIGLLSPLSDAIRLGANRLLVIGLQYSYPNPPISSEKCGSITLGDIVGTVLNSLFSNPLQKDVHRLNQTNQVLSELPLTEHIVDSGRRQILSLVIEPSQDLGSIDTSHFSRLPFALRYVLRGIGVSDKKGWELLNYLAFEKGYVLALMELGYQDALGMKEKILSFLEFE